MAHPVLHRTAEQLRLKVVEYQEAGGNRKLQNKVIMPLVWNEGERRANNSVIEALPAWLGVSTERGKMLAQLGLRMGAGGWGLNEHGLVVYRRQHRPSNAIADPVRQEIIEFLEIMTRPTQEREGGRKQSARRCTDMKLNTKRKLAAAFVGSPGVYCCISTCMNIWNAYLKVGSSAVTIGNARSTTALAVIV
jgi:hypothetical protein